MLANRRRLRHFYRSLKTRTHISTAFTLLELMLAVAIAVIIMMIAIPSMSGLRSERLLRESFEKLQALAYKAQANAITQQRAWVLVWEQNQVLLQPDSPTAEEKLAGSAEGTETLTFEEGEVFTIVRPATLLPKKETPGEWPFWRSGTCEPVSVTYEGPHGRWAADFHPLTAKGELTEEKLN